MDWESTPTLSSVIEMKNENVEIYPNYVDDYLTISGLDEDSFIRCEIFDLWGRIIMSKTINKNKLDLTNLLTGSYYIKINNEVVKSFIKK